MVEPVQKTGKDLKSYGTAIFIVFECQSQQLKTAFSETNFRNRFLETLLEIRF
jgi:hypothetical protein